MKKLNVLALAAALLSFTCYGYGQVAIIGSTGQFQNLTINLGWIANANQGGAFAWDTNSGQGETDFVNQRGAGSGGFNWYNTNSTTLGSPLMTLSGAGLLSVPGGVTANVTGNVSGSSGSTTGNAATATKLAATPSSCSSGQYVISITANGTPNCGTFPGAQTTVSGGSSCTTAAAGGSSCTAFAPINQTMPDTNYAVSCTGVSPSGWPSIQGVTKSTTGITITVQNGSSSQAVASGYTEIDCTISGS